MRESVHVTEVALARVTRALGGGLILNEFVELVFELVVYEFGQVNEEFVHIFP